MDRRRYRPAVEGMETRHMPSGITAVHVAQTGGTDQGGTSNQFLDPTGQLTPHEMRRQHVRFGFDGKFLQACGRFTDTASQIVIKAVGSSTYFLHGDLQLGAYVPTDPTQPTSGASTSFDRNVNTNAAFGFDLLGSTADVDRAGRPTKFTFSIDKNLSGGTFGQATGTGTVTIRYLPSGRHRSGVMSEGRALVLITGDVYTLGTNSSLGVLGSNNTLDPRKIKL